MNITRLTGRHDCGWKGSGCYMQGKRESYLRSFGILHSLEGQLLTKNLPFPKRRYATSILHRVKSQKSADLIYNVAEA